MSLYSSGYETLLQVPLLAVVPGAKWPAGQVMVAGRCATRVALFWMLTRPAGWGADVVPEFVMFGRQGLPFAGSHVGGLASGAPSSVNSTRADAGLALDMLRAVVSVGV